MQYSTVKRLHKAREQQLPDEQHKSDSTVEPKFQPDALSSRELSYFNNSNSSENYQENYTATYQPQDNISWILQQDMRKRLETFFSSKDFSILCLDFYILLASFKQDDHFNLDLLISKIVARAKNHLLYGNQQKPQKPKQPNSIFKEDELTSMFTGIFTNLSKNKLNIYSVRSIIYHPSFELNLHSSTPQRDISLYKSPLKAVGSYYVNFSSSAINILKRSSLYPETISKSQILAFLTVLLEQYGFKNKPTIKNQITMNFEKRLNRCLIVKDCDIMYNNWLKAALSWQIFLLVKFVVEIYLTPIYYAYFLENPWEIVKDLFHNFVVPILIVYFGMKLIKRLSEDCALYPDIGLPYIALTSFNKLIYSDLQYIESNLEDQDYFIKKNTATNDFEHSNTLKQRLILPFIKVKILDQQNISPQNSKITQPNDAENASRFNNLSQENLQSIETHKNRDEVKICKAKPKKSKESYFLINTTTSSTTNTQQNRKEQEKTTNNIKNPTFVPNTIVFEVGSINTKYPLKTIYYKDLKLVNGRYGNKYYIYWENNLLYNHRYKDNIEKLRDIFNSEQEVKGGEGSNGIKKLKPSILINKVPYIYELKSTSIASRIYGFIYPSAKLNRHIVIFSYFDNDGSLSNH